MVAASPGPQQRLPAPRSIPAARRSSDSARAAPRARKTARRAIPRTLPRPPFAPRRCRRPGTKGKAMPRTPRWTRTTVRLAREGLLGIDDGRGLHLQVAAGTVWLTQQDDGRDVVLREGESFVIDRPGRTLVQALDASELDLDAAN